MIKKIIEKNSGKIICTFVLTTIIICGLIGAGTKLQDVSEIKSSTNIRFIDAVAFDSSVILNAFTFIDTFDTGTFELGGANDPSSSIINLTRVFNFESGSDKELFIKYTYPEFYQDLTVSVAVAPVMVSLFSGLTRLDSVAQITSPAAPSAGLQFTLRTRSVPSS